MKKTVCGLRQLMIAAVMTDHAPPIRMTHFVLVLAQLSAYRGALRKEAAIGDGKVETQQHGFNKT